MSKYKFDFTAKLAKLKQQEEASKSYGDSRFWKYTFDKVTKKGSAIIRFLPDRPSDDALHAIQYFSHWFKYHDGTTEQKYINNCATSIGKECPVCKFNRKLFKSPHDSDEATARHRKRKVHHISNILVVKDPANPENEGKVFLWDYGPQIYSFLSRALYGPSEADEDYVEGKDYSKDIWQAHNPITGSDFHIRSTLKKNSDFLTYSPSEWGEKGVPIFPELDDDEREEKLDEIFAPKGENRNGANSVCALDEWLDPKRFPSELTVIKKLGSVIGEDPHGYVATDEESTTTEVDDDDSAFEEDVPDDDSQVEETKKVESSEPAASLDKTATRNEEMTDEEYLNSLLDK